MYQYVVLFIVLLRSGMTRTTTIAWGLDNGFEVVELNASESDGDDDDDDDDSEDDQFKETTGVRRIIEALSCHSWSNMIMKGLDWIYFLILLTSCFVQSEISQDFSKGFIYTLCFL